MAHESLCPGSGRERDAESEDTGESPLYVRFLVDHAGRVGVILVPVGESVQLFLIEETTIADHGAPQRGYGAKAFFQLFFLKCAHLKQIIGSFSISPHRNRIGFSLGGGRCAPRATIQR